MVLEYLVDFDGVILNSQEKFIEVMKDNVNFYDWLNYLSSIDWYKFLRECEEIDGSINTLLKLQEYKKLRAIITRIHSFQEGQEKLVYLRERSIYVPILYVLPEQKKSDVFIPNENTILVDDDVKNCIDWRKASGNALLFKPKTKKLEPGVINSLKQLL